MQYGLWYSLFWAVEINVETIILFVNEKKKYQIDVIINVINCINYKLMLLMLND